MDRIPALDLGAWCHHDGREGGPSLLLPSNHLVTHGVVVGMTGSGKTGLVTVLAEEALRAEIPTIIIDVKGDLPNLLLSFPNFDPGPLCPWVELGLGEESSRPELARSLAAERKQHLEAWKIGEPQLGQYCRGTSVRLLTPGATSGESLHILSTLERRSPRWDTDPESARDALSAAISLMLRLLGRDSDPAKSREHVLLSLLAERRLLSGGNAELPALMQDLEQPPLTNVGALPLNAFVKRTDRRNLAASINTLLASPTFASWREGTSLDIDSWIAPVGGRTPAVIVSVAHLDDEERSLVLGVLLEEIRSWMRSQSGSQRLRALLIFDEVYGYLPPHPANPPTKRPLVSLMKQGRAFGVGVVVATQNPMDLDYRALSNAGLWFLGRLQTDADRARVIDGLGGKVAAGDELDQNLRRLAPRWFIVHNTHAKSQEPILVHPRHAISLMRGPMTRCDLRLARKWRERLEAAPSGGGQPPAGEAPRAILPSALSL
jgi:hypothetical protein